MIPVLLKLSNFTSYGENVPELDFTKFHMAVISGTNGVGKSSILDSITWCVWGWSRAGDSADQLVRLGTKEMSVEFSFQLDDHIYTIKRRRSLIHGGSTALELWSNSHNLTEGTIKATQQKIIDLLHLSIETFTNSSFLRQGHADEFTTKGATDRKRILADILGLDHYDKLEEKAKEKNKEVQTKLSLLEYQLLEIEAELSQKEEREKKLSEAQAEVAQIEMQLNSIQDLIKIIDEQRQQLSSKIQVLNEKQNKIALAQKELMDLKLQVEIKQKAQAQYQAILLKKEEIEINYQTLQKLQEDKKALEEKRSELIKVKDQLASTQKILIERENKRNTAINQLEIEVKQIETTSEQLELQNKSLIENKTTCPTCNQPIGEQKNKEIITHNKKIIDENSLKIKELKEKLGKYKLVILPETKQTEEYESEVQKLEEETKSWNQILIQVASLEKYSQLNIQLQQATTAVATHQESISDLEKLLVDREKQITLEQEQLKELSGYEQQLIEVKQQFTAKETIKQELSRRHLELTGKVGEAKQLMDRTSQLEEFYQKKSVEKKDYLEEKEAYEELTLAFGKKGIQAMIIETAIPEIEQEANSLLDRLTEGRMKVRFETIKETKTKVANGEKGIVETLDIIISDEMGERNYEMYSGGESFRVNFAIRLALSKLLTRRAGAKLQFLVIDEGFGTQDASGRTRIIEVLDTIKNDFEKIIIITHLEELKEEFPTRIEVSKNSGGSTFQVIG